MRVRETIALGCAVLLLSACGSSASPTPTANPTTPPTGSGGAPSSAPSSAPTSAPASQGLTTVQFRFDWIETPGDTAIRSAIDQGFFKAQGLNVVTTVGTGSTDAVTLTGAGQFQFGQASALAVVVGVANGVPVKAIAVEYQTDANGMISRPDTPIRNPTDLYGKKYCVQQGSSLLNYQAVVAINKLDRSKITEVPIGFDIAPLIAKQCDGLIDFGDGELIEARAALKAEPVWAPLSAWGVNQYGTTLIVNNDFAASNPTAVKGFVLAYEQGLKWAEENPDKAIAMMQKVYSDADPKGLKDRVSAALKYFYNDYAAAHGMGAQDPQKWQTGNVDMASQIGLLKKQITAADVFTNDYQPSSPVMATPVTPSP